MDLFPSSLCFTLTCGSETHSFAANMFAKMSKRGKSLLKRGITAGVSKCRADPATFKIFTAACQLEKFRVNASNVTQLLNLALEWQVPSLERFCQEFIKKKGVKAQDAASPVDWLVRQCERGCEEPADILAVAEVINEALLDDRLLSLPPEVIFEIVEKADREKLDEQRLVTFVMRLLEVKPSSAGPVILLLNRELLSAQQRGKIARNRKIHEQDVQFFVGWTVSHMRNQTEKDIRELVSAFRNREGELESEYEKKQNHQTQKLRRALVQAVEGLRKEVEENQAKINAMIQAAKREANELAKEQKDEQTKLKTLQAEVARVNDICGIISKHSVSAAEEVKLSVGEEIDALKKELEEKITAVSSAHMNSCQEILDGHTKVMDEQRQLIDKMFGKVDKMSDTEADLSIDIGNVKAILLAKIIRDKIRSDKYIRDSEHRFDLFNDDIPSWNQTADQARKAEEFIVNLEAKLDKLCPIRGGQAPGHSLVSSLEAESAVSENRVEVVEVNQDKDSEESSSSSSSSEPSSQHVIKLQSSSDDE